MDNIKLSRRGLLLGSLGLGLTGCGIIGTSTSGTTMTVILNVAKVDAIFKAAQQFEPILLADSTALGLLGPTTVLAIQGATLGIGTALAAFETAAGGAVTVSFNTASVKSAFTTALADAETVLGDVQTLGSKVLSAATLQAIQAFETAVASAQLMVALVSTPRVYAQMQMTLPQALTILHTSVPAGVE